MRSQRESGAFVHVARIELRVCEDPEDPERRLLLPVKNNLAKAPGLAYRIEPWEENREIGVAVWEEGTVDITIQDVEADDSGDGRSALAEAIEWLSSAIKDGPAKASELKKQARAEGVAEKTLNRAKKKLKIKPYRKDNAWWWELPQAESTSSFVV